MIGGSVHFKQISTERCIRSQRHVTPSRTQKLLDIVRSHGLISSKDLSRVMGISSQSLHNVVSNATFTPGSLLYEDEIDGEVYYGWLT